MKTEVLIIEDDDELREAIQTSLEHHDMRVFAASNLNEGRVFLNKEKINIILLDINLGKEKSLFFLEEIRTKYEALPTIMMTAYGKISDAVFSLKQGAADYIVKPFTIDFLIEKINKYQKIVKPLNDFGIFFDPKSKEVLDAVKKIASSDASILISGESGTGKEVIAQYIHKNSIRRDQPFVAINCAALPEAMLESILFGYEKGAFTGAVQSMPGKFEQANNGTLLLDEISEMPLALQAKLLRVLQEREVERLGSKKMIKLNIRILATTNLSLTEEIKHGRFRQDLFFRLNVLPIKMPPLRDRPLDILPLAKYFFERYKFQERSFDLTTEAENKILNYSWPGNVRELQNVMQRAAVLVDGEKIDACHISLDDAGSDLRKNQYIKDNLNDQLIENENQMILKVLYEFGGNRTMSAQKLGISPRTLRYKLLRMKKMGLQIPS